MPNLSDRGQLTVLLVDPDSGELDRHAQLLHEMGLFNHLHAENGSEALAMYNNFKPEMVVACQETPAISGLNLLRLIRQEEEIGEESIFVLYSQKMTSRLLALAGRGGADMLFATPCESEVFKDSINRAMEPPEDEKDREASALFEESRKLMEAGELDKAIEVCQHSLDVQDNAETYFNMGYIRSIKGDLEEALTCFRKATSINRHHARAYQQMGLIYQKLGKADEAQKNLEFAAELHLERNQDKEAEEIFNLVLTMRPDTSNVFNSLGIIYRRQGRFAEAARAYEKAIKVHPDDENVYFNAARAYIDLKEFAKAQEALKKAVNINPAFTAAMDLLRATEVGLKIKV